MSRTATWALRAALPVLAPLAFTGCGNNSLSSAQLRNRATHICTVAARRTSTIAMPSSPHRGPQFLSRGIAAIAPEVAQLRALHGDGTFGRAVDGTAAELAALRFTLKGLRADNDPVVAIKTLEQRLTPLQDRTNAAWRSLGIPACVNRR